MRSVSSGLQAFHRLGWSDRVLFFEAAMLMCLVSACVRIAPFRLLARLAAWPLGSPRADVDPMQLVRRVRWGVNAATARVPWRAVCLHQSLVAQILLRRRGVASTLFYGARLNSIQVLEAHTWVRAGQIDVIGTENAGDFAMVGRFPKPV